MNSNIFLTAEYILYIEFLLIFYYDYRYDNRS